MSMGKHLMLAMASGLTSKIVRVATRKVMHHRGGTPRLPGAVRRSSGVGPALAIAAGTGALLAIADLLREQEKRSVRHS